MHWVREGQRKVRRSKYEIRKEGAAFGRSTKSKVNKSHQRSAVGGQLRESTKSEGGRGGSGGQ